MGNITKYQYYINGAKLLEYDYVYDELNQLKFVYISVDFTDVSGNFTGLVLKATTTITPMLDPDGAIDVRVNGEDYTYVHELDIGETPSLTFLFFNPDTWTQYNVRKTVLLTNTLNTSVEGFYYRDYLAVNTLGIIFRVLFKVGEARDTEITYHYSNTWLDLLTSYDVVTSGVVSTTSYTYDEGGNPTSITNFTYKGVVCDEALLSWDGRSLKTITVRDNNTTINWSETLITSSIMGTLNIFAGLGSGLSTIAGNAGKTAIDINTRFACRVLAGGIAGGTEALYDLISYLI